MVNEGRILMAEHSKTYEGMKVQDACICAAAPKQPTEKRKQGTWTAKIGRGSLAHEGLRRNENMDDKEGGRGVRTWKDSV
jgi:hypothetical protein